MTMAPIMTSPGKQDPPGQSREPWLHLLDGGTGTTALAMPAIATALPSSGTGTTGAVPTGRFPTARIVFSGSETTASADKTINYQVVLWKEAETISTATTKGYIPTLAAKGVATVGSLITVAALGDATATTGDMFCDTLTNTITKYTGVHVHSPADNSIAVLEIDVHNAGWIEIETDLGTALAADVFLQWGEGSVPFELHGLIGGIDDATTDSLHGKIGTDSEMGDKSIFDLILRSSGWEWVENLAKSVVRAAGATTLFTVTGRVEVRLLIIGETEVTAGGACDCSVGISGDTGIFVAAVDLDVNTIDAGEIWHDATPDKTYELASTAWTSVYMLAAGQDIIFTNAAEVTAGALDCYAVWHRVGSTGNVVAA